MAAQGFLITLLPVRVFFSPQPLNPDFRPILFGSDEIGVFSSLGFGEVWVGVGVYTKIHTKISLNYHNSSLGGLLRGYGKKENSLNGSFFRLVVPPGFEPGL